MFSSSPFAKYSLALASGIGCYLFSSISFSHFLQLSSIVLLGLFFIYLLFRTKQRNSISVFLQTIRWSIALYCIFTIGFLLSFLSIRSNSANYFFQEKWQNKNNILYARIVEDISEKENSWRTVAEVTKVAFGTDSSFSSCGKILLYFTKREFDTVPRFQYGDVVALANRALPMPSSAFPEDFDFKAVMRYQDVQVQIFPKKGEILKIGEDKNLILQLSYNLKERVVRYFNTYFPREQAGIAQSLLIGEKDNVSKEDLENFAISGTVHVLAVSGMHVGLLYLSLLFLFGFLTKSTKWKNRSGLITLVFLWLFVFVTGCGASVLRAGILFTVIELGKIVFARKPKLINSLFVAMFIQLCLEPLNLIDVGFQLSYAAVLGIAVFNSHIERMISVPNFLIQKVWQLTAVSISATLGTLPITLYFFSAFPLWFAAANIVIVPFSTFIIYLALVTLVFSPIPFLKVIFNSILLQAIHGFQFVAKLFSMLPLARLQHLYIDEWDALLIILLLIAVIYILILRKKYYQYKDLYALQRLLRLQTRRWILFGLVCLVILNAKYFLFGEMQLKKHSYIAIEVRNQFMLCLKHRDTLQLLAPNADSMKKNEIEQFMKKYIFKNKITSLVWHNSNKIDCETLQYRCGFENGQFYIYKGTSPIFGFQTKELDSKIKFPIVAYSTKIKSLEKDISKPNQVYIPIQNNFLIRELD